MPDFEEYPFDFKEHYQQFREQNAGVDAYKLLLSQKSYLGKLLAQAFVAEKHLHKKIPSDWFESGFVCPKLVNAEQCSDWVLSQKRFENLKGEIALDMSGGLGIDSLALSHRFEKVIYVERQPFLAKLAESNFKALGRTNIQVVCSDSLRFIQEVKRPLHFVFVDPDRRAHSGKRSRALEFADPNVVENAEILISKAEKVWIKASPMLDISEVILTFSPILSGLKLLEQNGECKELLIKLQSQVLAPPVIKYVGKGTLSFNSLEMGLQPERFWGGDEPFVFEPSPCLMKLAPWRFLAERFNLKKIAANTQLFGGFSLVDDFPGRVFQVEGSFFPKQHIGLPLHIISRNYPLSATQIRSKYQLKEGDTHYLLAFSDNNAKKRLLLSGRIR